MFFTDAIVKLPYQQANKNKIFELLGDKISGSYVFNDEDVFIKQNGSELELIKAKEVKKLLEKRDKENKELDEIIYAISKEEYDRLTRDRQNPLLNPQITDRLGIRLASSFASNMAKIVALFFTAALMPIISIAAVPIVFALAYLVLHSIRYKSAFGRWPNKREFEHLLGYAFAAGMEMSFGMILFSLLSGASIFAPVSIHIASLLTLPFGGPLVTYLLMPIIMATILSVGIALFNMARVLITHFFDIRFHFSKNFPFFFTIHFKQASERDSLSTLGKKLFITGIKEFAAGFITSLISIYLSFIPGGLLAGVAAKSAASTVFTLSLQISGALLNSLVIALGLDKLFDTVLSPKMSSFWDKLFRRKSESTTPITEKSSENNNLLSSKPSARNDEEEVEEVTTNTSIRYASTSSLGSDNSAQVNALDGASVENHSLFKHKSVKSETGKSLSGTDSLIDSTVDNDFDEKTSKPAKHR